MSDPSEPRQPPRSKKGLFIGAGVLVSFLAFTGAIITLTRNQIVTPQIGLLMFVALIGMYVGFGILIGTWHLIAKL